MMLLLLLVLLLLKRVYSPQGASSSAMKPSDIRFSSENEVS